MFEEIKKEFKEIFVDKEDPEFINDYIPSKKLWEWFEEKLRIVQNGQSSPQVTSKLCNKTTMSLCYKCEFLSGMTRCHRYHHSCSKGHFEDDEYGPDITECNDFREKK